MSRAAQISAESTPAAHGQAGSASEKGMPRPDCGSASTDANAMALDRGSASTDGDAAAPGGGAAGTGLTNATEITVTPSGQPQQCDIDVVRTTAMPHRRGSEGGAEAGTARNAGSVESAGATSAVGLTGVTKVTRATGSRRRRWRWVAFGAVITAAAMDLLDSTIAQVAAPTIRSELGGSYAVIEWVTAAYALAMAAGLLTGGRMGDMFGRRRVLLNGMEGFVLA